jgi:16S rRNA (guanine527-N7)-methyltransferase
MTITEIIALLRPFAVVNQDHAAQILMYINILLKWNARVNLTAVRRPEHIVKRHFGESLFAAGQLLLPGQVCSIMDLGSGAGFPGLPIAMWEPKANITLIESNGKKAVFLNEVVRSLGLGNVAVFNGRGEDYGSQADWVIMRAVEKFDSSMLTASALVAPQGRLALMIGESQIQKAKELGKGFVWQASIAIPGGESRVLLVGTHKQAK